MCRMESIGFFQRPCRDHIFGAVGEDVHGAGAASQNIDNVHEVSAAKSLIGVPCLELNVHLNNHIDDAFMDVRRIWSRFGKTILICP